MNLQEISVTILTKNSQKYLKKVLNALEPFGEVLLYDNGSIDDTFKIASQFRNVKIIHGLFIGFGPTHNMASASAKNEWILSIDHDEIVSNELIQALLKEDADLHSIYSFPRHNYFNEKFIKWCGWYPDRQIRLYNRTQTRFTDDQVHEAIISSGMVNRILNGPIIHYSYDSIADFLAKMQSYSSLFAIQNCGKKKSSFTKAVLHGSFAFVKSYILKKGFLGGYEGFVISKYNGHTAYYKYLKLLEANTNLNKTKR